MQARLRLVYPVFFLSGAASLVFESLWFRLAGLTLGNSIWASSLVLSSFMAGLALGNALCARYGDRMQRPIRLYALLELGIAVTSVGLVLLMPVLNAALAPLFRPFLDQPWVLNPLRLTIAFTLMVVPTTAMGATLPLLVKGMQAPFPEFGRALGMLYGINTLGAVAGALAGEMVLIRAFGLRGAGFAAGGMNIMAAVIALWIDRRQASTQRASGGPHARQPLGGEARRLLAAAFLCGAALLAMEVLWFRFMLLFTLGTSLVFAIMLATVLAGIGIGGVVAGWWLRRPYAAHCAAAAALVTGALALSTYALFAVVGDTSFSDSTTLTLARALRLMLPVSVLSGVLFTLIGVRLHSRISSQARAVGLLTMANTIGAMIGALLGGFLLLPATGLEPSFVVVATVYAVIGVLLAWDRVRVQSRVETLSLATAAALFILMAVTFPYGTMRERIFPLVVGRFAEHDNLRYVAHEGVIETIFYIEEQTLGRPYTYRLVTNGISMSGTGIDAKRYMKMFVYLPVAIHPAPRDVLLISYGVGSTAKAMTDTAELRHIDIVDISRDILSMNELVYPDPVEHPLNDPRVNVYVDDGRFLLQVTDRQYDLITGEPPPPKAAGIVNLYTREYFRLVYDRLSPGGMATYWLPMAQLNDTEVKAILRAFLESFDDASLWIGSGTEWILLGLRAEVKRVDEKRFTQQWADPIVGREMRALGFELPQELGATFVADKQQLAGLVGDTPPLVDNHPHRLSSQTTRKLPDDYVPLVEWGGAQRRFASSEHIRRLWPPSMIEQSLPLFYYRVVRHDVKTRYRVGAPTPRMPLVHHILTKSDLRSLVHRLYGTDVVELGIAAQVVRERGATGRAQFVLGCAALADRRYAQAAALFRQSREAGYRAQLTVYDEMYALCMAGSREAALKIAQEHDVPDELRSFDDGWWGFAEATFGLSQPSR